MSCEYSSITVVQLKRHTTVHSVDKLCNCILCSKSFKLNAFLKKHMSSHGAKVHKCDFCDYSSKARKDLKLHVMTHTGEKPHCCTIYNYSSTFQNNLKEHIMRRHTDEKPKKCLSCNYSCVTEYELKHHTLTSQVPQLT